MLMTNNVHVYINHVHIETNNREQDLALKRNMKNI